MKKPDDPAIVALIRIKTVLRRHQAPGSPISKHEAIATISAIVDEVSADIAASIPSLSTKDPS